MVPPPQEHPPNSNDHNGEAPLPPAQSFAPPVEAENEPLASFNHLQHQPEPAPASFQDASGLDQSPEQKELHVSDPPEADEAQNQTKVPYKSFKKKYRKMEAHFAKVMAQSDGLHAELIRAQRLFNRLLREKYMLTDLIMQTNTSHLAPELQTSYHLDDYEDEDEEESGNGGDLTEQGEYYNSLLENSFEYSDDEKAEPLPNNPVSLLEWLKRNQPSVLAADQVFDKPPVSGKKKLKGTDVASPLDLNNSKKRKNPPQEEQLESMSEEERKKKQAKFVYY